jgi:hypothetical protein
MKKIAILFLFMCMLLATMPDCRAEADEAPTGSVEVDAQVSWGAYPEGQKENMLHIASFSQAAELTAYPGVIYTGAYSYIADRVAKINSGYIAGNGATVIPDDTIKQMTEVYLNNGH